VSFGWSALTWAAVTTAAVTAVSAVNTADNARSTGNRAKDAAKANAIATDEANNKANRRSPDTAAALASAILAGKSGQSGTMLTGPQGVDTSTLMLGKATLLGG
jgi:hypothetical protein